MTNGQCSGSASFCLRDQSCPVLMCFFISTFKWWPSGQCYGSISFWTSRIRNYFHGSGSFVNMQKIRKKTSFLQFCDYYLPFVLNDVNVPSVKRNKQKKCREKNIFANNILNATEEKSNIRIRNPVVRIPGSVSKRHGSGTLPLAVNKSVISVSVMIVFKMYCCLVEQIYWLTTKRFARIYEITA